MNDIKLNSFHVFGSSKVTLPVKLLHIISSHRRDVAALEHHWKYDGWLGFKTCQLSLLPVETPDALPWLKVLDEKLKTIVWLCTFGPTSLIFSSIAQF